MVNRSTAKIEDTIERIIQRRLEPGENGPGRISFDTPLFGDGLGLDSLEALEIAMEIEAEFGIFIEDDALTVDLFENMGTLTSYVSQQLK